MLFYGVRTKTVWAGHEPASVSCESCGQAALHAIVLQWYFHVFWLPLVPFRKTVVVKCAHCRAAFEPTDRHGALAAFVREAKAAAKTPMTLFTALIVLAVSIALRAAHVSP